MIAVDDEHRQKEGNLVMAASLVNAEALSFMIRHGTGLVCVGMKAEDLERLKLPLMLNESEGEASTAFTITVVWALLLVSSHPDRFLVHSVEPLITPTRMTRF